MAFKLTRTEPLPLGLRRIAREEIALAIRHLGKTREEDRDEAVHAARKCLKKVRGVIRLLTQALGGMAVRDNASLRETGLALAQFRDAAALVETVDSLLQVHSGAHGPRSAAPSGPGTSPQPHGAAKSCAYSLEDPARAPLALIRETLVRERDLLGTAADPRAGAIATLKKVQRLINFWRIGQDDFAVIAKGLKATYRRGRRDLARAKKDPTPENLHALRKRVKDHWYHVRLLESIWPAVLEARSASLKDLQEDLGNDHNLVLLEARLSAAPGVLTSEAELEPVRTLIAKAREDLRERAIERAEPLYEQKPGQYVRRLRNLWEIWRSQPLARREPISTGARRRSSAA